MHDAIALASVLGGVVALGIILRFVWRFASFMGKAAETLGELRPNGGGSIKDKVDQLHAWKDRYEREDRAWKQQHSQLDEDRFAELRGEIRYLQRQKEQKSHAD